jgi:hypothetical protein
MQNAMKNFQDLFPNFQEGPVINIGELMNRASEEGCSWYHFGILIKEGELTMDSEMLKLGYGGLIIKGREIVNYKPVGVKYFKTEDELQKYYTMLELLTSN